MALLTCANLSVLRGRIVLPRVGAWYADLTLDGTTAPAQGTAVTIANADNSLSMNGTVLFSGVWMSHVEMRIDGGGGGLDQVLNSRFYASSPTVNVVLRDLMRDSGEQLDSSVDSGLLNATLASWTRRGGTTASLLADLVRFGCAPGVTWRVLANGKVWLGSDTFSTTVTVQDFDLMNEAPSELQALIATEGPDPGLIPGVLFQYDANLAAGRVSQVEHEIDETKTRTTLWLDDPTYGDRAWGAMSRSIAQVLGQARFLGVFPGTVTGQDSSDFTLQVQLDDPTQDTSLSGMTRLPNLTGVKIRTPFPSSTTKVNANARVLVAFEGGSPQHPVVIGWDPTVDQLAEFDVGTSSGSTKLVFTAGGSVVTINASGDITIVPNSGNVVSLGDTAANTFGEAVYGGTGNLKDYLSSIQSLLNTCKAQINKLITDLQSGSSCAGEAVFIPGTTASTIGTADIANPPNPSTVVQNK